MMEMAKDRGCTQAQ
jgi:chromosome segregation ATPase